MRLTWQEIQEQYPDRWVLMKDMEFVRGELISAVVIYDNEEVEDVYRFEEENPDKVQTVVGTRYTGDPIYDLELTNFDYDMELTNFDNGEICLAEEDLAYAI